jgi:5'-phosphate synthase pdxT subunit
MNGSNGRRRGDAILSPELVPSASAPADGPKVGVLALQGDFREHRQVLAKLGVASREVRTLNELEQVEALIIPGGESTTIGKLMRQLGLLDAIRSRARAGMPIFGTCAGLITLAKSTAEGDQPLLGLADVVVRRNAFGRQLHSFEADLTVAGLGPKPVHGIFIRAPWIERAGPAVEVLATYQGHIVAARQGNILLTAFHPELTSDTRMHELFVRIVREQRRSSGGGANPGETRGGVVEEVVR